MFVELHHRRPADDLHDMLNVLKVNDMYTVNILSFVNKCLLLDIPPIFADNFKYQEVDYDLRFKIKTGGTQI